MSDPTVRQKVSELSFEDIFSNVADIKAVATQFLAGLEEAVGPTLSFDSNVGVSDRAAPPAYSLTREDAGGVGTFP